MKLIELLKTLDKLELNAFGRYIKALIKDEKAYDLFKELKKHHPEYKFRPRFKEITYDKIYNAPFNNRKFNHLTSNLAIALEEYLILAHVRKNKMSKQFLLLEFYKERREEKHFERTANEILEGIESDEVKSGKYYLDKMRIHYDLYFDVPTDRNRIKKQVELSNNIVRSIDEFYIYYKLKIEMDLKAFSTYQQEREESFILKELFEHLPNHPLHKDELVNIYHFYLHNYIENDIQFYEELKLKIFKIIDKLPKVHQTDLFSLLNNYIILGSRKGLVNSNKYLLEIYKLGIEKEYLIKDGRLGFQTFSNAVITAINLLEIDWAKKLIKTKQHLLDESLKDDCLKLAKANVAYAEKKYLDVLYELNTIQQFRHYMFAVQGRFLLLKTYLELALSEHKLGESIYSFADAYRYFLRRNKILGDSQKSAIHNTIKFTLKILDNHYTKNEEWESMKSKLTKSDLVYVGKSWLFDKLDYFINKKRRF